MRLKGTGKPAEFVQARRLDKDIDRVQAAQDSGEWSEAIPSSLSTVKTVFTLANEAQPDAAFVEALSARLQGLKSPFETVNAEHPSARTRKVHRGRSWLMRLSWGMTVVCTVIVTLVLVLISRPTLLPPERILAEAAAATTRRPGMVEHIVVENHLMTTLAPDDTPTQQFDIVEEWRLLGSVQGDGVVTTAHSTIHYAIADVQRQMPLSWAYESEDQVCYLARDIHPANDPAQPAPIIHEAGTDAAGCMPRAQSMRVFVPELAAPDITTGLQLWLKRLQSDVDTLAYEQTTFFGKAALSFTESSNSAHFTLYLDPDTKFPLGFVAQTPTYTLTQIVHIYEIVPAEALASTPFTWPPVAVRDAQEAEP